ncbi:MAG: hypothetical protein OXG26_11655 [Caldilineaceae bacterium]|nr:hypothetical protein [Caldilineaceae bacterium]
MKMVILICLSALVAGCSAIPPTSTCPTDDAYEYLACVKPSFPRHGQEEDEFTRNLVTHLESYCEDDAAKWLPIMEESVRTSLPEVKELIESGQKLKEWLPGFFTLEEQAIESLDDKSLYSAVVAMHLLIPMMRGQRNLIYLLRRGGSCVNPSDCKPPMTGNCVREYELFLHKFDVVEFMKE